MLLARVAGQVWGTKQAESLLGERLLVVQPLIARVKPGTELLPGVSEQEIELAGQRLAAQSHAVQPRVIVAVDRLGAGPGEFVLVAHGSRCRDLTLGESVATKDVIVAIVDDVQTFLPRQGTGASA